MKSRISPIATQKLLTTLLSSNASSTSVGYLFRNGADPWAITSTGKNILQLCLEHGKQETLSMWVQSAKKNLSVLASIKNPMADQRIIDLMAVCVYLSAEDRQGGIQKFLFSPNIEQQKHFINSLMNNNNPQSWSVIGNMMLLRPEMADWYFSPPKTLHETESLSNLFVENAGNHVLCKFLENKKNTINMTWFENKTLQKRILSSFLHPDWCHIYKNIPNASKLFSGSDEKGNTPLLLYIQDTPPDRIHSDALAVLSHFGNDWHQKNENNESAYDVLQELLSSNRVSNDVKEYTETLTSLRSFRI